MSIRARRASGSSLQTGSEDKMSVVVAFHRQKLTANVEQITNMSILGLEICTTSEKYRKQLPKRKNKQKRRRWRRRKGKN